MKVIKGKDPVKEIEVDDREPMDRVADELIKFTATVQALSKSQAEEITKVLKLVLAAVEKPQATPPREWKLTVVRRNSDGMIEGVRLVANDNKNLLQ